jgi:Uncharacterized protein conserved in cyanobacteria
MPACLLGAEEPIVCTWSPKRNSGPWTAVRALPDDGRRYELIDAMLHVNGVAVPNGNLDALDPVMTPSPRRKHQRTAFALARILADHVEREHCGEVSLSPADLELIPGTIVQPDVFVTPLIDGRPGDEWEDASSLLLAVEILSPSTARTDRIRKRAYYQGAGVPEYWIIDGDSEVVERWRPRDTRPEIVTGSIEWHAHGAEAPLTIDLDRLFRN